MTPVILASGSQTRAALLSQAGISFTIEPARVDEDTAKESLLRASASPRDIADALAELKARKVAAAHPNAVVIGADQVLAFCGRIVSKCPNIEEARALLRRLSGKEHQLVSAVVLVKGGAVVWRFVSTVEMQMREFSDATLDRYLETHGESVLRSVGGYKFEGEGAQLFSSYSGDYFAILGLPLLPLLNALRELGVLPV